MADRDDARADSSQSTPTGGVLARGVGRADMLPWPLVRASSVFELRYGKALVESSRKPGLVPVYGSNGRTGWHDSPLFHGPGVVLGRKGMGNLGVKWVDGDFWVIDTAYSLDVAHSADLKFAYYLIGYVGLNHLKDGSSNPSLTRETFGAQLFPLPPLDEQRRIAAVLGALDDLIETDRRAIANVLQLAMTAFSVLTDAKLDMVRLGDVTTKIGSGATPRGGKGVYQQSGIAFIRSQNVYDGQFAFDGLARISDAAAESLRGVTVILGDVLINITGESVTRTTRVPNRALPARVSQHVAIVRPNLNALDPGFLLLALLAAPAKGRLNGLSSAGATRRALTKSHLEDTLIPLPPLADQHRVSRILDAINGLEEEVADLTRTRDELLPLLMCGKVRVPEDTAVA